MPGAKALLLSSGPWHNGPMPWGQLVILHVVFLGVLAGSALAVVALWRGAKQVLNRCVACFGSGYALWCGGFWGYSLGWSSGADVASLGMFTVPAAAVGISLSQARLSRRVKKSVGIFSALVAVGATLYAWTGRRWFPELAAQTLDDRPLSSVDHVVPWLVYGLFGVCFLVGAWGLAQAWKSTPSKRVRRQVQGVLHQLVGGLAPYVALSLVEWQMAIPRWGVVVLLYPVVLNFLLIAKDRYLILDGAVIGAEVLDRMDDAVLVLDHAYRVVKANPAATRLFSSSRILHTDVRAIFARPEDLIKILHQSRDQDRTLRGVAPTLSGPSVLVTVHAHIDPWGDVAGWVLILRDDDPFVSARQRFGWTAREEEVARLVVTDKSVRQMAEALFVSEATIKTHLHHLYQKTGAKTRVSFLQKLLEPSLNVSTERWILPQS